ncbi:MAG: hypothetical protein SF028_10990 [Candidatus Sumerlaeia bacterium]|nr:hypothetical protein [Candidatus Sumerlaeia bacterium]
MFSTKSNSKPRALAALAASLLAVASAGASVVPMTLEQLAAVADEIHTVRVESSEPYAQDGRIYTRADLSILESFKGELSGKAEVHYVGGEVKVLGLLANNSLNIREGDEAVLFLSYPLRRLPAEEQAKYNTESATVTSPQLVGGFQGKFLLGYDSVEAAGTARGSFSALESTATVARAMAGSRRDLDKAPVPYAEFRDEIRRLVAESESLRASRAKPTAIAGIRGEFHVPARSAEAKLARYFDPLPAIAYMTEEERAEYRGKIRAAQAEAEAKRAAAAPPAADAMQGRTKLEGLDILPGKPAEPIKKTDGENN